MSDTSTSASCSNTATEIKYRSSDQINDEHADFRVNNTDVERLPTPFFKLWIHDIRTALVSPIREDTILFKNKPVDFVIIFGTITKIVDFSTKVIFELDDCTGNINCVYYIPRLFDLDVGSIDKSCNISNIRNCNKPKNNETSDKSRNSVNEALENCFQWLQKEVNSNQEKLLDPHQPFNLGDTVCVKGAIKHCYRRREIRVFTLHKIDNLIDESTHIMERVHLYKNEYVKF